LTLAQVQTNYAQIVETTLGDLRLPQPASLVDYEVTTNTNAALQIKLIYLSNRDIENDALRLLTEDVRSRFESPDARVDFERIEVSFAPLTFARNQTEIGIRNAETLDDIGRRLQRFPSLQTEIVVGKETSERDGVAEDRSSAIFNYFVTKWQVADKQVVITTGPLERREAILTVKTHDPISLK
jgi:hypothetical protein